MVGVIYSGVLAAAVALAAAGAGRRPERRPDGTGFGREMSAPRRGVGQTLRGPGGVPSTPPSAPGKQPAPGVRARLDLKRRLAYHERFLREVAESGPKVEVSWDIEVVRRSLRFVADGGDEAGSKTAAAVARVFAQTEDEEARRLCLAALYRINNERAKRELLLIWRAPQFDARWRELSVSLLRRAAREGRRISASDAKALAAAAGEQ